MNLNPIDLRSDTVTRPTAGMREAMARAAVGDDVFGDDPTVHQLQDRVAALLGKEAALFVPTGTMANLIALRTWTEPGDEVICEAGAHIYLYEGGGYAAVAGLSIRTIEGKSGLLEADAVRAGIRPERSLSHFPRTRLVAIENTANRGGGTIYRRGRIEEIVRVAQDAGLRLHCDGARLWNAAVALDLPPSALVDGCDSVSVCLSKGLGCPAGSVLAGPRVFIERAHRFRKMFGGGMRQSGVLAAAGLYALDHHVARLRDDHDHAQRLATALAAVPGLDVDAATVETNMVYVGTLGSGKDASWWVDSLARRGVTLTAVGASTLRAVCHLDVDAEAITRAIDVFASVAVDAQLH